MSTELLIGIVVASLASLAAITISSLVLLLRSIRATEDAIRRIHLQQASIAGMLLRAGFRPAPRGRDWFDDGDKTRDPYGEWFTQWGMSRPP